MTADGTSGADAITANGAAVLVRLTGLAAIVSTAFS